MHTIACNRPQHNDGQFFYSTMKWSMVFDQVPLYSIVFQWQLLVGAEFLLLSAVQLVMFPNCSYGAGSTIDVSSLLMGGSQFQPIIRGFQSPTWDLRWRKQEHKIQKHPWIEFTNENGDDIILVILRWKICLFSSQAYQVSSSSVFEIKTQLLRTLKSSCCQRPWYTGSGLGPRTGQGA